MASKRFEWGRLIATAEVDKMISEDPKFNEFVNNSLIRYCMRDWGDTCDEDAKFNDDATVNGGRIAASYKYNDKVTVQFATEPDRSLTTMKLIPTYGG